MCGRYRFSRRKQTIEQHFDCDPWDDDWSPRYNIAPTQSVPVIRQHPKEPVRKVTLMRWGLIPSWAKDPAIATSTINAKSETAATKPAFRDPLKLPRCLIPTDGFYEWKRTPTSKQPYCFEVNGGELFAFAGIWDGWRVPNSNWVKSCSILTTTPNAVTATVHDRMPVILDPDSYDLWLDPGIQDVAAISESLMQEAAKSTILDRELEDDKSHDSGLRIHCPLCGWSPRKEDHWFCTCGHSWNTFDTGGVCPACLHYWTATQCLSCGGWPCHSYWYTT